MNRYDTAELAEKVMTKKGRRPGCHPP